ncbi:hypothetical protein B0T13DRAFT_243642 [Neurospora crassa]|nr:hypothetical protein B0T13DRAFT_243642 [Neurospora crassa]
MKLTAGIRVTAQGPMPPWQSTPLTCWRLGSCFGDFTRLRTAASHFTLNNTICGTSFHAGKYLCSFPTNSFWIYSGRPQMWNTSSSRRKDWSDAKSICAIPTPPSRGPASSRTGIDANSSVCMHELGISVLQEHRTGVFLARANTPTLPLWMALTVTFHQVLLGMHCGFTQSRLPYLPETGIPQAQTKQAPWSRQTDPHSRSGPICFWMPSALKSVSATSVH